MCYPVAPGTGVLYNKNSNFKKRYNMDKSYEKALKYCLNLLSRQDYPELELIKKLEKKGNDSQITEKVINFLKSKNYLNDRAFMERIIEKYTLTEPAGRLFIAAKLETRGFAEKDYNGILSGLNETKLAKAAMAYRKKSRPKDKDKFNNAQYWGKYLALRGFEYDIIEKITDGMKEEF
jgi:SOS response regulatory protein OraA/RecX